MITVIHLSVATRVENNNNINNNNCRLISRLRPNANMPRAAQVLIEQADWLRVKRWRNLQEFARTVMIIIVMIIIVVIIIIIITIIITITIS